MNRVDIVLVVSWVVILLIASSPLARTRKEEAISLLAIITVIVAVLGLAMGSPMLLLAALLTAVITVSIGTRGISANPKKGPDDDTSDEH